jgi:hypothetical protein
MRTDEDYVYVASGLNPNHQIVMSAVSSPYDGMPVRTVAQKKASLGDAPEEVSL